MKHFTLFLTIILQTSAYVLQPTILKKTSNDINNTHISQINGQNKESPLFFDVVQEETEQLKAGLTLQNSVKFSKTKIGYSKRSDEKNEHTVGHVISEISLQWLNKAAMKIIWPDQGEEVISLTASKHFPDSEDACMFVGRPENKNANFSSAAIIGCIDSEETIVNLIADKEILELVLLRSGRTLQNMLKKTEFDNSLHSSRQKRSLSGWKETGGSIPSTQPLPNIEGATEEDRKIPKGITFPLDLGYDESLYKYFGSSSKEVKDFIKKVAFLAETFFYRPETGLPIINWDLGDIKPNFDININADKLCCNHTHSQTCRNKQKEVQRSRKGNSKPLMLFVEDRHPKDSEQYVGCAFEGAACGNTQGEAIGVVDMTWQVSDNQNIQPMARTMAHEFGHLIGMAHDFVHHPSRGCNHQGLMSYNKIKETWSTCSVKDFKLWWRKTGFSCKEIRRDYGNDDGCKNDEFRCKSGTCKQKGGCSENCIPQNWVLDGEEDCTDGSDESTIDDEIPKSADDIECELDPSLCSEPTEEEFIFPKIPKITFPLDLGYDNRLLDYFGSHSATKNFILETVSVSSDYFNRPSTGLPIITFDIVDIKHYGSIHITADQLCLNRHSRNVTKLKKLRNGNSTPLVLFVEDLVPKGSELFSGCAFWGAACGNTLGEALAIVDMSQEVSYYKNLQNMAVNMAHQFGHLIGMALDSEHPPSSGCNQKGIMSYGSNIPKTWSNCSVKDFKRWWRRNRLACEKMDIQKN